MIKGIYEAKSGLLPKMLRLEVMANNLANINTKGYKKDNLFVQALESATRTVAGEDEGIERLEVKEFTDFSQGSLAQTGNPLDLAIEGKGFFVVETPQGLRYTRNGHFMLSGDGAIVTSQGFPILGQGGQLHVPNPEKLEKNLVISERGEVIINNMVVGRFRVVNLENCERLRKHGDSFYTPQDERPVEDIEENSVLIRQGFLEESNVDGVEEMISMVELSRSFEAGQKSIQYQDSTLEKAIEIGRL